MCALLQVTGTRRWLRKLGLPVKLQWRPWKSATGQVGGYYEVYDGLTFATIRDAGHMVQNLNPIPNGQWLCASKQATAQSLSDTCCMPECAGAWSGTLPGCQPDTVIVNHSLVAAHSAAMESSLL